MNEVTKIFKEGATPRRKFVEQLKKQFVSQAHETKARSNFLSKLFMKLPKISFRVGTAAFLVVAAGAGILVADMLWFRSQPVVNQDEILAQIAGSNESSKNSESLAAPSASRDARIGAMIAPGGVKRDYNYIKTENEYQIGAGASKCLSMVPYKGYVTKEVFVNYYATKDEWMPTNSRSTVYAGNDIYSDDASTSKEDWHYRGGEYVMHITNVEKVAPLLARTQVSTISAEEPALISTRIPDATTDSKNAIKDYFGDNVKIFGKEQFNGHEVYKIQWSYNTTCATSTKDTVSTADFNDKIVTVSLADVKTFKILKETSYKDSVSTKNMLYSRTGTESTKTVSSFDEVKSEFAFNYSVPQRTVDATAFQYDKEYRKALVNYVKENATALYYLKGNYKLQSAYSTSVVIIPDDQKYMIDWHFYSTKPYGVAAYHDYSGIFDPVFEEGKTYPTVQLGYGDSKGAFWTTISEFRSSISTADALKGFGLDITQQDEKGKVTLVLAGKEVEGTLYQSKTSGNSSEPSAPDVPLRKDKTQEDTIQEFTLVVPTEDAMLVIQSSVPSKTTLSSGAKAIVANISKIGISDTAGLNKALTTLSTTVRGGAIAY